MENILRIIKKIIPHNIFRVFQPAYHFLFAFFAALVYRFPSHHIKVVAITGTKGKTSTTEIVNAILEEAGYRTAVAGTLRFKIGDEEERNLYKMTIWDKHAACQLERPCCLELFAVGVFICLQETRRSVLLDQQHFSCR